MKITQISTHIWSLKSWMLFPVHVWVIVDKNGVTLVDAGVSFMGKGIVSFLEKQAGPLQNIVLTHGHSDHVGAIKHVLAQTPVPVYAHRDEIPYCEGTLIYPKRKKIEVTVEPGILQPLPEDENGQLLPIGSLRPFYTPGHSPGHVVYYHEQDDVLLTGDLFTSKRGQLRRPIAMFTADMQQAIASSQIVAQLQPQRLEVCHGYSVFQPAQQIKAYMNQK